MQIQFLIQENKQKIQHKDGYIGMSFLFSLGLVVIETDIQIKAGAHKKIMYRVYIINDFCLLHSLACFHMPKFHAVVSCQICQDC